jgi:predicted aspartyl protease
VITGTVIDGRATIPVTFRLTNQPDFSIDFVIDTGFTGSLCLPLILTKFEIGDL